jgi:hypothetical protein
MPTKTEMREEKREIDRKRKKEEELSQKERDCNTAKKMKLGDSAVLFDTYPALRKMVNKTLGILPPHSPFRMELLKLVLGDAWRSTPQQQADFFGVSLRTIGRVHDLVWEDTQLAQRKYPLDVTRDRSKPEVEEEARSWIDEKCPFQSSKDWRLCPFNDNQLYRLYKTELQVINNDFLMFSAVRFHLSHRFVTILFI